MLCTACHFESTCEDLHRDHVVLQSCGQRCKRWAPDASCSGLPSPDARRFRCAAQVEGEGGASARAGGRKAHGTALVSLAVGNDDQSKRLPPEGTSPRRLASRRPRWRRSRSCCHPRSIALKGPPMSFFGMRTAYRALRRRPKLKFRRGRADGSNKRRGTEITGPARGRKSEPQRGEDTGGLGRTGQEISRVMQSRVDRSPRPTASGRRSH